MNKIIKGRITQLTELCARHQVRRLELFGSAVTRDFDPEESDLDFVVEFLPLSPTEHADAYFGLLESLQDLFQCHIDLLEIKAIGNPYLLRSINRQREVLYAA